jgi:DNA mismatch repair protein MutL
MHAAHERITYERLKHQQQQAGIQSQPLLVPHSLAVSEKEAQLAEDKAEWLRSLGLGLDRAGPETLLVRQVPVLLNQGNIPQLVRDLLADLITHGHSNRLQETLNSR